MQYILSMDNTVLDFIQTNIRCAFLDFLIPVITRLGDGGFIWILAVIFFFIFKKYRWNGVLLLSALVLSLLFGNVLLKNIIARIRPCDVNTAVGLLIAHPGGYSFPSGHSMSSFAAATVIYNANRHVGIAAIILAALIAFSRMYLYVHYPSDVIAGMVLGILTGLAVIAVFKYLRKNRENEKTR